MFVKAANPAWPYMLSKRSHIVHASVIFNYREIKRVQHLRTVRPSQP